MQKYLRAIGFSDPMSKQQLHMLLNSTVSAPTQRSYTTVDDGEELFAEFRFAIARNVGIAVCGTFDAEDHFDYDFYFPYLYTGRISTGEVPSVEQRLDNDSWSGVCDDMKVGVTVIFRLQNEADYVRILGTGAVPPETHGICLSGLSLEGTVMLPIEKSDEERRFIHRDNVNRLRLLNNARNGDEQAMQNLTMGDMDIYAHVLDRLRTEDVFSLVDSYFMPNGAECEQYSVLGEIVGYETTYNTLTGEEICLLTLDCNELRFDVAINRKDLYGEPAVGRRFRGIVWMQGTILFDEKSSTDAAIDSMQKNKPEENNGPDDLKETGEAKDDPSDTPGEDRF